jgi:hypothetical protein
MVLYWSEREDYEVFVYWSEAHNAFRAILSAKDRVHNLIQQEKEELLRDRKLPLILDLDDTLVRGVVPKARATREYSILNSYDTCIKDLCVQPI